MKNWLGLTLAVLVSIPGINLLLAQGDPGAPPEQAPPGGMRGADGPMGGPMGAKRELVKEFDRDGNGRLDDEERKAARESAKKGGARGPGMGGRRGPGGPGGPGGLEREPGRPGPKVAIADAKVYPEQGLYDAGVLRTLFFEFSNDDWEAELGDFMRTDVEVPADLTVDGKRYPQVGVRFRGASSLFMVPAGSKRSLNVSIDHPDGKQRLLGYKTLNLLNCNADPSFLHAVLFLQIARNMMPAPKANLVRVVINGESWGIYANAQQFNKELLAEAFGSTKGARWKVPGSPGGGGGLQYLGDDIKAYRRLYEIASNDNEEDWRALIALCKSLAETPAEELEQALASQLDVESTLRFLALDVVLVNNDGYWTRASDFCLYRDEKGKFHLLPHDANETFAMGGGRGPGGRGPRRPEGEAAAGDAPPRPREGAGGRTTGRGMGGGGVTLDPLVGLDDVRKPLRSKLLAVPALRQRYLDHVKQIATEWLDWQKLGPIVASYRELLADQVALDTRKLSGTDAYDRAIADSPPAPTADAGAPQRPASSLRAFADQRRKFLLAHPALQAR